MTDETVYVELKYPEYARWIIIGQSPANDGWVFAREVSTGHVLSFPPGALRALANQTKGKDA